MKVIELKFENGDRWQIPLSFIANNRTNYYQKKAQENDEDFNHQEEYSYVMEDDYEGIDWLQNNMNYEDFEPALKVIPADKKEVPDWINANSSIIEVEDE